MCNSFNNNDSYDYGFDFRAFSKSQEEKNKYDWGNADWGWNEDACLRHGHYEEDWDTDWFD